MILLAHIAIGLASLIFTTYVWLSPSRPKLTAAYALVGATLGSGTLLVVVNPAHLTQACTSGLVYLGLAACGIIAARHKLSRLEA
jgi:hypothetical protein